MRISVLLMMMWSLGSIEHSNAPFCKTNEAVVLDCSSSKKFILQNKSSDLRGLPKSGKGYLYKLNESGIPKSA